MHPVYRIRPALTTGKAPEGLVSGFVRFQGSPQGGGVNVTGEVDRTFPVDRIPSGRIGRTEILHLETDADDRFFRRQVDNPPGSLPGGPAGGTSNDTDGFESAV